MTLFGFEMPASALTLGAITGLVYGLMAAGLVLVYRATRVINFAHGQIGAFAAAVLGVVVTNAHVPYWIGFLLALGVGAGIAAGTEVLVVRRLARAPLVMTIVGLIGAADFLLGLGLAINSKSGTGAGFPKPPGFWQFHVGVYTVNEASTATLVLSPIVVGLLAVFFRRSRFGIAIRAAAANPKAAELAGVSVKSMGTLAWAIAGALSAMTAVLILPTRGIVATGAFGPSLLLRALIGAVIARMVSLPVALIAGVGVGVLEQLLMWNYPGGGATELVLLLVLLVALMFQRKGGTRERERGSYLALQPWRPLPEQLRAMRSLKIISVVLGLAVLAFALSVPSFVSNRDAIVLAGVICFTLVGLAIVLLTGDGGQVSLGQFGIAAVGGVASFKVAEHTANYALSFLVAGIAAALFSVLIGLPALRIRGLMLAVTTLAAAEAVRNWLLARSWMLGDGVTPKRPAFGTFNFDASRRYYYFCVGVLVLALFLTWNYRRSGLGRQLRAVRDNEDAARAFTVRAMRVKLYAFASSGFIAGLGGALYVHSLSFVDATAFPLSASINVVALSALGGIGLLVGPMLGALYIIALPSFVNLDGALLAATSLGWLLLVLFFPGGLAQAFAPLRERLVNFLARQSGLDPVAIRGERGSGGAGGRKTFEQVTLVPPARVETATAGGPLLEATGITKKFGALVALNDVSIDVREGEILGIIGSNGAGKTTLYEVLSGYTRPDAGQIRYNGQDVTRWTPEARGRAGLIRSFQDGALFATLTVEETLQLAGERVAPTKFAPAVVGLTRQDKRKREQARELMSLLGLESYRDHQIAELSTGTRRIVELGSLVALSPKLLLLDEPSSGIAQRESEALGEVLLTIKNYLDATLVLIEHDMPLIMGLSDRMVAMSAGQVLTSGTPDQVKSHPEVIDSYLGLDPSDEPPTIAIPDVAEGRCAGTTKQGLACSRSAGPDGLCGTHRKMVVGAGR